MPPLVIIAVVILAVATGAVAAVLLMRSRNARPLAPSMDTASRDVESSDGKASDRPPAATLVEPLPVSGLLVPDSIALKADGVTSALAALEREVVAPLALEYRPIDAAEIARYRAVPVNATVQQALAHAVRAIGPKQETLFRAVLPAGKSLVEAAGGAGFRGFAMSGSRISAQALLVPASAAAGLASAWPLLAVGATVMALDVLAQREQRAFQRRVEAYIHRQEKSQWRDRVARQRSIADRLSASLNRVLDGEPHDLETVLQLAGEEFQKARIFYAQHLPAVQPLAREAQKHDKNEVDWWHVKKQILGGSDDGVDRFASELQFARVGIALNRRALVLEASAAALASPSNSYLHLKQELERQAQGVVKVAAEDESLTRILSRINIRRQLKPLVMHVPIWARDDERRDMLREAVATEQIAAPAPPLYLALPNGEIKELLGAEDEVTNDS